MESSSSIGTQNQLFSIAAKRWRWERFCSNMLELLLELLWGKTLSAPSMSAIENNRLEGPINNESYDKNTSKKLSTISFKEKQIFWNNLWSQILIKDKSWKKIGKTCLCKILKEKDTNLLINQSKKIRISPVSLLINSYKVRSLSSETKTTHSLKLTVEACRKKNL